MSEPKYPTPRRPTRETEELLRKRREAETQPPIIVLIETHEDDKGEDAACSPTSN